jgi:hypothetical protein
MPPACVFALMPLFVCWRQQNRGRDGIWMSVAVRGLWWSDIRLRIHPVDVVVRSSPETGRAVRMVSTRVKRWPPADKRPLLIHSASMGHRR